LILRPTCPNGPFEWGFAAISVHCFGELRPFVEATMCVCAFTIPCCYESSSQSHYLTFTIFLLLSAFSVILWEGFVFSYRPFTCVRLVVAVAAGRPALSLDGKYVNRTSFLVGRLRILRLWAQLGGRGNLQNALGQGQPTAGPVARHLQRPRPKNVGSQPTVFQDLLRAQRHSHCGAIASYSARY
jgi:hypothetical protein